MASTDISGVVTDSSGNPVENAIVEVVEQTSDVEESNIPAARTTTDANGEYTITDNIIAGTGPWHVVARFEDADGVYKTLSRPYVQAALADVIDDFEDQDIAEYTGDTGAASITTDSSFVGNLDAALAMSDGQNEIRSTSGLSNYPAQGDIWRWQTYIPSGGKPRFGWGVQDSNNLYFLEYNEPDGLLRFVKREGGTNSELATASVTFPTGEYVETEIEWRTNGRHLVEVFDSTDASIATLDVEDSSYTSGGVLWGEYSLAILNSAIHHIKFSEGSGTAAADDIGNLDLTLNTETWSSGNWVGDYAFNPDGTDDEATTSTDAEELTQTGSWSIGVAIEASTWPSNGNPEGVLGHKTGDTQTGIIVEKDSSGTPYVAGSVFDSPSNSWVDRSSTTASEGKVDIIYVFDNGTGTVYSNATTSDEGNIISNGTKSTTGLVVGSENSNVYFGGLIGDVRIYNKALTQSEVEHEYNRQPWS